MKTKQVRTDRGYILRACRVREAATETQGRQRSGELPRVVPWLEAVGLGKLQGEGMPNWGMGCPTPLVSDACLAFSDWS